MSDNAEISPLGLALLRALQSLESFPAHSVGNDPQKLIRFSITGKDEETVGIADDVEELTIYFDDITHIQVGNFDDDISDQERNSRIIQSAIAELDSFFAGRSEATLSKLGIGYFGPQRKYSGEIFRWPRIV